MTLAEKYAMYGITYKNGKILSPFGTWISLLIPVGTNTKVGAAGTWSMFHGNETHNISDFGEKTQAVMTAAGVDEIQGTCPFHCKDCYCDAGRYNFDANKASAILKALLARMFPEFVEKAIIAQIKIDGIKQCRIHAQGDFFSKEYCNMWVNIANACDDVTFWTYTKFEYALKVFESVKNISIVPSITPVGLNFGTCAELLKMHSELTAAGYRVHICACGTEFEKHCSDCKTGCKAIGKECDYVLFIKHSTRGYKAGEKDPAEFAAVKDIIKNQDN